MPLIVESTYKCRFVLANGHVQTCLSSLFRRVNTTGYRRERIATPDNDFLDLDWARIGTRRLAVLAHGLEGDSGRAYMLGMVNALTKRGWDAVAWNARGCSGEPNRVLRFTHSGATEDLDTVISHIMSNYDYSEMALIGFSLGNTEASPFVRLLVRFGPVAGLAISKVVALGLVAACFVLKRMRMIRFINYWYASR